MGKEIHRDENELDLHKFPRGALRAADGSGSLELKSTVYGRVPWKTNTVLT